MGRFLRTSVALRVPLRVPLLASLLVLGGCEQILGPSRGGRAPRPRYGDHVMAIGAVTTLPEAVVGDTLVVRMESLDPAPCTYGGSAWLSYAYRAYVVPFGVRAGNPRCPPAEARVPVPVLRWVGLAPKGEVAMPVRVVVCQADGEPITRFVSVGQGWIYEDTRDYLLRLRDSLYAEVERGEAGRADRKLCATAVVRW